MPSPNIPAATACTYETDGHCQDQGVAYICRGTIHSVPPQPAFVASLPCFWALKSLSTPSSWLLFPSPFPFSPSLLGAGFHHLPLLHPRHHRRPHHHRHLHNHVRPEHSLSGFFSFVCLLG